MPSGGHSEQALHETMCCACCVVLQFGYALRALVINEFTGPDWQSRVFGIKGAKTLGQAALVSFDFATSRVWITYGVLFL